MLALGRLNARHLTLKRTAARGCSVPGADIELSRRWIGANPCLRSLRDKGIDLKSEISSVS